MKKHWDRFYAEERPPTEPTEFCRFVMDLNLDAESAVDLGCGNGRDTDLLATRHITTIGIDPSTPRKNEQNNPVFFKKSVRKCMGMVSTAGLVYSRFFLHSISDGEIDAILDAATGYVAAETRIMGDIPKLHTDHDRNLLDPQILIVRAMAMGYIIIHYSVGHGVAKFKNEDPLVARIVMRKRYG